MLRISLICPKWKNRQRSSIRYSSFRMQGGMTPGSGYRLGNSAFILIRRFSSPCTAGFRILHIPPHTCRFTQQQHATLPIGFPHPDKPWDDRLFCFTVLSGYLYLPLAKGGLSYAPLRAHHLLLDPRVARAQRLDLGVGQRGLVRVLTGANWAFAGHDLRDEPLFVL